MWKTGWRLGLLALVAAATLALPGGGSSSTAKTIKVTPVADAFVVGTLPRSNFGRGRTLMVDRRPPARAYLRFRVRKFAAPIRQATLQLYVTQVRGRGFRIAAVRSHRWSERRITAANAPASTLGASSVMC